jgi:hypothetical protein
MSVDVLTKPSVVSTFPGTAVEAKLRAILLGAATSTMQMLGKAFPVKLDEQYAAAVQLDSLDVVGMLCEIEPLIGGFQLKDSIVRSGGYGSVNDALNHLMPRIEKAWAKHSGASK